MCVAFNSISIVTLGGVFFKNYVSGYRGAVLVRLLPCVVYALPGYIQ